MNKRTLFYIILTLSLLLLLSAFLGGIFTHKAWVREHTSPPDTVTVSRIEYVDRPVPVEKTPAPDSIPSVKVKKEDIIPSKDTSAVEIRPEVTTYRDTLDSGVSYDITVSGVGAQLQDLRLWWPQKTMVQTKPFKGWSVDLVGRGLVSDVSVAGLSGFAGVEVGYTSDRFSFGIGPGVLYHRPPMMNAHQADLAVSVSMKFRIATIK